MTARRLRPHYQLVEHDPRRVTLHERGGRGVRLATEHVDAALLCATLRGGADDDDLAALAATPAARAELAAVLEFLDRAGALLPFASTEGLGPARLERFARLEAFYGRHDRPDHTRFDCLRRLAAARVLVLGVGSLGSWALQHLVASGVGALTLVDRDVVEASNLARQCFFLERHVGKPKVEAAVEVVRALSSLVEVRGVHASIDGEAAVRALLAAHGPFDLVLLTADEPMWQIAPWCAAACRAAGVPLLRGNSRAIGPLTLPDASACPACAWPAMVDAIPGAARQIEAYRADRRRRPVAAAISTTVARMGAELGDEALRFLAGLPAPRTIDAQLAPTPLGFQRVDFPRHPACPVCGAAEPEVRHAVGL